MKKHYLLSGLLILLSMHSVQIVTAETLGSSITIQDEELKKKEVRDKWNAALGTFQFQVINSRLSPSIDVKIIEKIEQNRHKTDTVYIPYADNIRIMILPADADKSKKLELIKYITE